MTVELFFGLSLTVVFVFCILFVFCTCCE